MKNEYFGLKHTLDIIEAEQDRLEEENQTAIEENAGKRTTALFQQMIAVNAVHKKVQAAIIEAC